METFANDCIYCRPTWDDEGDYLLIDEDQDMLRVAGTEHINTWLYFREALGLEKARAMYCAKRLVNVGCNRPYCTGDLPF